MVKARSCLERLRRRRNQRGMAVFLVVLVLTMVSAISIFAMHSASLVNRATGFNRQNVQATAIVEFGMRGAATWLGPNKDMVESTVRTPGCAPRLLAADTEAPCAVVKDTSLSELFVDPTPSDGLVGLLNSPHDGAAIRAEVVTELTEAFDAPAAARAGSAGSIKEMTLTTTARVFPTDALSTTVCGDGARGAMSQQRARAHVIIQL